MRSHPPTSGLHRLTLQNLEQHMVRVEGGTFNAERNDGQMVTVQDFEICRLPVTQWLWNEVMGGDPKALFFKGMARPVEGVNSLGILNFCNRLNEIHSLELTYSLSPKNTHSQGPLKPDKVRWEVKPHYESTGFRIPTWPEWIFAAKGGKYDQGYEFSGGKDIDEVAWNYYNSFEETHPVGLRSPNALGIFDLSGNVWEFIWEFEEYPAVPLPKPGFRPELGGQFFAGGSWDGDKSSCKVSSQVNHFIREGKEGEKLGLGFRLARTL